MRAGILARPRAIAALAALALLGTAGSASASAIIGGSSLLSASDVSTLEGWLGEGPLTLTNIFSKTAGDSGTTFHAAVDGKGRTFVVMAVTGVYNGNQGGLTGGAYQGGPQVIGGYDPQSWNSGGGYNQTPATADMNAFIFNLTAGKMKEQVNQYQTVNNGAAGPIFGGGYDLNVNGDLNAGQVYSYSYCDPGTVTKGLASTSTPPYSNCQYNLPTKQLNILGEAYYTTMEVGALEVFTIDTSGSNTGTLPEPATLGLFGLGLAGLGVAARRWRRAC